MTDVNFRFRKDMTTNDGQYYRIECIKDIPSRGVKVGDIGGFAGSVDSIRDNAWIFDDAIVDKDCIICGNTEVRGHAYIHDSSTVSGNSIIKDNAEIFDSANIIDSELSGSVNVDGDSIVKNCKLNGDINIQGWSILENVIGSSNFTTFGMMEIYNENITNDYGFYCLNYKDLYSITITPENITIRSKDDTLLTMKKDDWFKKSINELEEIFGETFEDFWIKFKLILKSLSEVDD